MYKACIKLPAELSKETVYTLGEEAMDGLSDAHTAFRENNKDDGLWLVEWFMPGKPDCNTLSRKLGYCAETLDIPLPPVNDGNWTIEDIPDINWLEHSYNQFQPFAIGDFYIYGSHIETPEPGDKFALEIDAATAFGSGEHGTTEGCIRAMQSLKESGVCPWNVLDMGTGSGILAIVAWKLWKTPILAVDIDEESIRVATRHQGRNAVPTNSGGMVCVAGDGFRTSLVQEKKPFDMIIANILAGPLKDMAADMKAVSDDNGYIILSGILNEQATEVVKVYEDTGFTLTDHTKINDWSTLVMQNR